MWYGWLLAERGEKKFLESLGVKIIYELEDGDFSIEVEDLDRLNSWWGRFYWGLSHI